MKTIAHLTAYHSRHDIAGNCYWFFRFIHNITGTTVEGKVSGGEINIAAIRHGFSKKNEWDATISSNVEELGIRDFNRITKNMPYAGSDPTELQAWIKARLPKVEPPPPIKITNDLELLVCSHGNVMETYTVTHICETDDEANAVCAANPKVAVIGEDKQGRIYVAEKGKCVLKKVKPILTGMEGCDFH